MAEQPVIRQVSLSNHNLALLPAEVVRPQYDRSALRPGIVHIGLGNFHRAHQAWYLHRLMQTGEAMDWAIIGAGVRPNDAQMRERLLAQDCLTTLIELDPAGRAIEVIGGMVDFLPVETGHQSLIKTMSSADIRIVSLTVTEGGYYLDPDTGGLDTSHQDIVHDAEHPETPVTAFGAIVAALRNRRAAGLTPFTGLCCDNLQGNGDILRQTVVGLAQLSDPELAEWINREGAFPNSMVDCIVPATGPNELELVKLCGIEDEAPVTHENFRQWVIEDDFCMGRPAWDKVGVTFTDHVHDYETMKLRVLNAGHQVIANIGELLSVDTIAGCMQHPLINALFNKVQQEEIAPHVKAVPGMTPIQYIELIDRRFSNPTIVDTTRRVAFDGSSRHPGFLLPIIRDALASGGSIEGLALVEAIWARMCEGSREDHSIIEPNDPHWTALTVAAYAARHQPEIWLQQKFLYSDLVDNDHFCERFSYWLEQLWSVGVVATVGQYTNRFAI